MKHPFLIFVDGPMGSGKTTTTKLLNSQLPDAARIAFPDVKRLIPNYTENSKTIPIIKEVMKVMIDKYLEHGVSVIVEQITKREGIDQLKMIAEKRNALFYAYRLSAPKNTRWDRVQERTHEMMSISKLPESKVEELRGYFEPNNNFYEENLSDLSIEIDTSIHSPAEVAEIIKASLQ